MEGMLTYGAVTAFHYSLDDLFAKGKNFYYIDQGDGLNVKREYVQWDLDSAFGSKEPNRLRHPRPVSSVKLEYGHGIPYPLLSHSEDQNCHFLKSLSDVMSFESALPT